MTFFISDIAEEVILAVLADFEKSKAEDVIYSILEKIENLEKGNFTKQRIVTQLEVISNLRGLQPIVEKLIPKVMAFDYDIKNDIRYIQGEKEGIEKGMEKGIEKGVELGMEKMIIALLKANKLSPEEISKISGFDLKKILEIKKHLK